MAKIVMIGGGSYNWTPALVRDMVVKPELANSELWLVDINKQALADLGKYCQALFRQVQSNFTLHLTTDRKEALPKADFVVITISTGGFEAMRPDLEIPYKYGIYQPVGDTVGPGGISRSMRNIPVFLDFAADIKKYCPKAWVLNLTNPMTVLTQVLCEEGCKTIGMCHELYSLWNLLKEEYKCDWSDIGLEVAGLNHFAFILSAKHKKQDGFDLLRKLSEKSTYKMPKANANTTHGQTHGHHHVFKFEYFRRTGRMLYPGDRHISEFFPNVLTKETGYGKTYNIALTKIKDRYKWLSLAKKRVKQWTADPSKIDLKPSREAMSELMVGLLTGKSVVDVVNLPNRGQIENLPRGVVVETMATVTANQISPHSVGELPEGMASLLNFHANRYNMIIEAARKGDRRLLLEVMATDLLVREWSTAGKLMDALLKANKKYLPQF